MPEGSAGEKTEQPTSRRLSKAREGGMVPMSMELISAVSLSALTAITVFVGPGFIEWTMGEMRQAFTCNTDAISSKEALMQFLSEKAVGAMLIASPFFIALMVSGIGASIFVSGFNISFKSLAWRLDTLNPTKNLKSLFSVTSLVKLGMSIIKLVFIGVIVYQYLKNRLDVLASFQWIWSMQILTGISKLILGILIRLCIGLFMLSLMDMFYQKWKYTQKLKMSKQEVKDERRNSEGPPEVQRRIRQKQFEIAMRRMLQDVPKADVVVVNPTHVAVALQYDSDKMGAPVVVAKGGDHICEKIKEVARAYGVPIIRRPSLARNIFARVEIGYPIPDDLFIAVAEVLALIHRMKMAR